MYAETHGLDHGLCSGSDDTDVEEGYKTSVFISASGNYFSAVQLLSTSSAQISLVHSDKGWSGSEAYSSKERIVAKAICAIAWAAIKAWWLLVVPSMVPACANVPLAPDSTKILQVQK